MALRLADHFKAARPARGIAGATNRPAALIVSESLRDPVESQRHLLRARPRDPAAFCRRLRGRSEQPSDSPRPLRSSFSPTCDPNHVASGVLSDNVVPSTHFDAPVSYFRAAIMAHCHRTDDRLRVPRGTISARTPKMRRPAKLLSLQWRIPDNRSLRELERSARCAGRLTQPLCHR